MQVLLILLLAVPSLLVVLYLQFRWRHRRIISAASKLPCPPRLPLLGNALCFTGGITSLTENIEKYSQQFRKLFCFWIGPVPLFMVTTPQDAQIVLNSSNTLSKDEIYDFLSPYMGDGLFTAPVCTWKKYRRLISPVMHPSNVERFLPVFNELSRVLADRLSGGQTLDPRSGLFTLAMDAITRTVLARGMMDQSVKDNIQYLLDTVGGMFTYRLFKVWLHVDWIFNFLYHKEVKESLQAMSACFDVMDMEWKDEEQIRNTVPAGVQNGEFDGQSYKSLLDLINFLDPNDQRENLHWKFEMNTMIVGATDTVVASLAFTLISLANHPEIQDKAYEEIASVVRSHSDVTLAELNALPYLGQVINETMRLHGTLPVTVRRATKDVKLSDATLPAGSRIMVFLHAMGLDGNLFPDPDQFRPERFSPESSADRHVYSFLPFSGGPRNCIGKLYAMMIMKTALVHVLRRYRLSTDVRLQDIEYELKVVMCSKTPLVIRFEHR